METYAAILSEVASAVTGLPTTGSRVEIEPARPVESLPDGSTAALAVVPVALVATRLAHDGTTESEFSLSVVVYAKSPADRETSQSEVVTAVLALATTQRRVVLERIDFERQAEGTALYAAAVRFVFFFLS